MTPEPITAASPHSVTKPVMRMSWRDLTFLHWPYDPVAIRPLVPAGLELDLYDGLAWVGLVPFLMTDVSLPSWPALPWISEFPETNVRTYVWNARGERGVWFFSLDAARLPAVFGGRTFFSLPYYWAKMRLDRRVETVRYVSQRRGLASVDIEVHIGSAIARPSEREHFLTARWRLFAEKSNAILQSKVHHPPWPLHTAQVVSLRQNLLEAAGLPGPTGDPLVHFSPNVDVLAAGLE